VRADFEHSAIAAVVTALQGEGVVDDEEFAREFARQRRSSRGYAPARIERELRTRGVERERAHRAAWGAYERPDGDPEGMLLDEARTLLERRSARYRGLETAVVRRRLAALLERAGFPGGVALDAVDAELERMRVEGLLGPSSPERTGTR